MLFETYKRDGGYFVKVTWRDGEVMEYGPFDNVDASDGFIYGFDTAITCDY